MFRQRLDPTTGRIPEPRTPKRGRFGGVSLALFSRDPKHRATARVELLELWQCARMLLKLYIRFGRGTRCRSWRSDKAMAEVMARSGLGTYCVAHVRVCRRMLEDIGLIRSVAVAPHSHHGCLGPERCKSGHFPSPKAPDVDGGGVRSHVGGRVIEVNLAAILGEAPLWEGPLREMGWQDAREARERAEDAPDASPPAPEPPRLVALPGGRQVERAAAQVERELEAAAVGAAVELAEDAADRAPPTNMDDHGGVIMDAHSCDLGSPSENLSGDRGPATSDGPGPRALRAPETHATAGMETHDAKLEAARAAPPVASPSGPRRPSPVAAQSEATTPTAIAPREQRTRGEQTPSQTLAVDPGAIAPKDLAELRKLFPDAAWSWASPRVVPLRGGGGGSSSGQAPPPAAPSRAPRLFDDEGPMGRNGERPPGWRGPGGWGRGT